MIYKCWRPINDEKCQRPYGHRGDCNPDLKHETRKQFEK